MVPRIIGGMLESVRCTSLFLEIATSMLRGRPIGAVRLNTTYLLLGKSVRSQWTETVPSMRPAARIRKCAEQK